MKQQKYLLVHQYNLIIVARSSVELEKIADDFSEIYGVQVLPIAKDFFKSESAFELYGEIKAEGIQVDVLVNNAGQGVYGRFIDTDIYEELDIIQLNINAYVVLTKLFLRDMVERLDGKILNVASIAGKIPGPFQSVYHGTKAFVHSFTEAIRAETADMGVTITSLLPGATDQIFSKMHIWKTQKC